MQNYNRYAYCFNNPLRYTDPTGHYGEDPTYGYYASNYYSYSYNSGYGGNNFGYGASYSTNYGGNINYSGYNGSYFYSNTNSYNYSTTYSANNVTINSGSSSSTSYGLSAGGQSYNTSYGYSYNSSISYPNYSYQGKLAIGEAEQIVKNVQDNFSCPNCLDPSSVGNNLLGLTYPGGNNPRSYNGEYNYSYVPKNLAEYPAIGHDRRYDNLGVKGASGLLLDPRAIGADWTFVAQEFGTALSFNSSINLSTRLDALTLGIPNKKWTKFYQHLSHIF